MHHRFPVKTLVERPVNQASSWLGVQAQTPLCISLHCFSALSNAFQLARTLTWKQLLSFFITYADALITNLIISQSLLSGGFVIHGRESYSAEINEPQIIFPLSTVTCNLQPPVGGNCPGSKDKPLLRSQERCHGADTAEPPRWETLGQLNWTIAPATGGLHFLTRPSITIKPEHTVFLVLEAIHSNSGMGSIVFRAGKSKYKTPKSWLQVQLIFFQGSSSWNQWVLSPRRFFVILREFRVTLLVLTPPCLILPCSRCHTHSSCL